MKYCFKNVLVKATFNPTFFEILLFEGMLVLPPAQRDAGCEKVKFFVKNQKKNLTFVKITWKVIDILG